MSLNVSSYGHLDDKNDNTGDGYRIKKWFE